MKIENISKSEGQVNMTLNEDELVLLCNTMHCVEKAGDDDAKREAKRELFHKVYADLIIARDLCQYGHIDDLAFKLIMNERNMVNYDKAD